ncbi:MAG: ATP-binding protein [Magnetococcales bacterium]|nr:ATP-binding protein [Magnetococcales bacterium]
MLIQLTVGHFRSFQEPQTLDMVAVTPFKEHPEHCIETGRRDAPKLLKSSVIYGPNAAGKSNWIQAMGVMKKIVVESAKWQSGDPIPVDPFLFDPEDEGEPSLFEVVFISNKVRYQYGFTATKERVEEEWLYSFGKAGEREAKRTWIERGRDVESGEEIWNCPAIQKMEGKRNLTLYQEKTRNNALFLSTAIQLNSPSMEPVFGWFRDKLRIRIDTPGEEESVLPVKTWEACREERGREWALVFLKLADASISHLDIDVEIIPRTNWGAPSMKELLGRFEGGRVMMNQKVLDGATIGSYMAASSKIVEGETSSLIKRPWDAESVGTHKMFLLAGYWLELLNQGLVLFIDELDNSLHHKLVRALFDLVHDTRTNPQGAQLIATTHDVALLDSDLLRRDQIWMIEKGNDLGSELYPISDFDVREEYAFQKRYLNGRYGALPILPRLVGKSGLDSGRKKRKGPEE